jgi:quercetin dioxygenase-like cupin family protein
MTAVADLMKDEQRPFEHHSYHAVRPNFRIIELHISPSQEVPWHRHTNVQDTLYVLSGLVRVELNDPREEAVLNPGEAFTVPRQRPHRVTNAGIGIAEFLVLQGMGEYDFSLATDHAA